MLNQAVELPAKLTRLVRKGREDPLRLFERALGVLRAGRLFRGATLGSNVCATGEVEVKLQGALVIGRGVTFLGGMIPTRLIVEPRALLVIGDDSVFNYGASLEARRSIRIGQRCMFASFVRIADTRDGRDAPIVFGDDVWVAHGATVYPGVTVGEGSVISAGSVVTRDVPPRSIAVGNPARFMALTHPT